MSGKRTIIIILTVTGILMLAGLAGTGYAASAKKDFKKQLTTPTSPTMSTVPAAPTSPTTPTAGTIMKESIVSSLPSVKISYFKKKIEGDTSTMMMSSRFGTPTSASIDLGDEITLQWGVEACRSGDVRVSLSSVGSLSPASRETLSDECEMLRGERTVRPSDTITYTLTASGVPVSGSSAAMTTTKTFQVNVQKPVLEVLDPQINQNTLEVKFFARNSGDADFRPTPINVSYEVYNGRTGPTIFSGSFTTPRMGITKGQRVELGAITLPDKERAFAQESIRIRLNIGASYVKPLRDDTEMFYHDWTKHTVTLDNSLLNLMSMGSTCEIRLNNYNAAAGSWPAARMDSFITLNILGVGDPMTFDTPVYSATFRMTGSVSGHTYIEQPFAMFINQITTLSRGRAELFTIENGKLKIHLSFENSGGNEVKLGFRDGSNFQDSELPDINIGSFTVDVLLTPGFRNNRIITYTRKEIVVPTISASLTGRFEGLNPLIRDYLGRYVRSEIISQLNSVLSRDDIKQAVENGIAGGLGGFMNITRIISVVGSGGTIVITYL